MGPRRIRGESNHPGDGGEIYIVPVARPKKIGDVTILSPLRSRLIRNGDGRDDREFLHRLRGERTDVPDTSDCFWSSGAKT